MKEGVNYDIKVLNLGDCKNTGTLTERVILQQKRVSCTLNTLNFQNNHLFYKWYLFHKQKFCNYMKFFILKNEYGKATPKVYVLEGKHELI